MDIKDLRTTDPSNKTSNNTIMPAKIKSSGERKELNPLDVGIKPAEKVEKNDILDALNKFDEVVERKQEEAREFIEAAKDLDGDLTIQEFDKMKEESQNYEIQEESMSLEDYNKMNNSNNSSIQINNVLEEDNDVLEEDLSIIEEELNMKNDTKSASNISVDPVSYDSLPELDDDDFDDLDEEDKIIEDDSTNNTADELKELRKEVTSKLNTSTISLQGFRVSNRPAAFSTTLKYAEMENSREVADWALMNSNKCITMKKFTGTEIETLENPKGRSRLHSLTAQWKLIYNHIIDPYKPDSLEKWLKVTSFLDIEHLWFAIYNATFCKSNHLPYDCNADNCNNTFLTENIPIMDMVKFKNPEAKERFNSILAREAQPSDGLYKTTIIPLSETYAFAFREPSVWNVIFENAYLDDEFTEKYDTLLSVLVYIDKIFFINRDTMELQPVETKVYKNNITKTIKSRIRRYAEIIRTLDADQYNTIMAYMQSINERGDDIKYILPEVTCPKCKHTISESEISAQSLVFLRHQLGALKNI